VGSRKCSGMKPVWVLIVVSLMSTISFAAENVVPSKPCGLRGITHFVVRSGISGGPTTGGPDSVEFAIAPLLDDHPQYRNAIFVTSDPQGKYEVALPPGRYWVGARLLRSRRRRPWELPRSILLGVLNRQQCGVPNAPASH